MWDVRWFDRVDKRIEAAWVDIVGRVSHYSDHKGGDRLTTSLGVRLR
jgi:hypothetical protein